MLCITFWLDCMSAHADLGLLFCTRHYAFFCGEPWGVSSEMHEILYKSPNVTKLGYVRPTKIQLSLCISTVWSESSLSAFWILKDTRFPHPINEDSDQISQPRWFEYSMGAHVRRYLFSCWGSYCVFSIFITTKKTKFVLKSCFGVDCLQSSQSCCPRDYHWSNVRNPGDGNV